MRILQLPHRSAPVMGWALKLVAAAGFSLPLRVSAQSATDEVTFHKNITPILQRISRAEVQ